MTHNMKKRLTIMTATLCLCLPFTTVQAQQKSEMEQRAEQAMEANQIATARYSYIRAFEGYAAKGQMEQSAACGVKATGLYYKENYWQEAFDLLRRVEQTVTEGKGGSEKAALQYLTTKERLHMYMKLRKAQAATEQLALMEQLAREALQAKIADDLLYEKAICYYTLGQNQKGDATFREMAAKLTASKEYDKVDKAYQTLIDNGRKSGSVNLLVQSYRSYIAWKDSTNALKTADEIGALKEQISLNEQTIAEKDSSLAGRMALIIGISVLAAALAAALILGAFVLMRYILLTRKQKSQIKLSNETNALKAKFINNISQQLNPTLEKLDQRQPEVKALMDFSAHVQQLSELENAEELPEKEEVQIPQLCEQLADGIRQQLKPGVELSVNAPKMNVSICLPYVNHIVSHLLKNAAEYTPADGHIVLDFKKRSAHTCQFLVSNTGSQIDEEQRDEVFKPFTEVRDLTLGDGLGLPICKQMAIKMGGDLTIDPTFTKGVRFVLALQL